MKKIYKIGVYRNAGSYWHGGQIYFDNLITLLSAESDEPMELVIIETDRTHSPEEKEPPRFPTVFVSDYFEKEKENDRELREKDRELRKEAKRSQIRKKWWHRFLPEAERTEPLQRAAPSKSPQPELTAFTSIARDYQLDFVFPLPAAASGSGVDGAGWIPDLQHCFLPELFEPADINTRNEMFQKLSEAGIVVFSSETSRDEFRQKYTAASAKLEVWSFCSNIEDSLFADSPMGVVETYHLPERFFLVANQFWKHKDHIRVVEALIQLKSEGLSVPLVFTGTLQDYRGTGHVDHFLQSIQRGGIHDSVHLLGFLSREEQLHLMRSALAVIQPSRFEGWSTVVEDCKALGQRLILSDLAVHREQAPPNSVFFPTGDASELAAKIRGYYLEGPAEWLQSRESREMQARSKMRETRSATRGRFLEIVERSQAGGDKPA